jgi:hypothetical protein
MPDPIVPAIPEWLAHRPNVGGLVVPQITPCTPQGRYLFGSIEQTLTERALRQRRCGVCDRPLGDRLILFLRLSDLPRHATAEPALDPVCAHYTASACPMVNGRLANYRTSPAGGIEATREQQARQGALAEPWFAAWLTEYHLVHQHGHLAASYAGIRPLRIRPVTWRLPEFG